MTKIIVDINVANLEIRALRPLVQTAMPTSEVAKIGWWESKEASQERLNKRELGLLKVKALKKAERIVNREGGINILGQYGSIEIDEKDFVNHNHQ
jgi:hypothetical protein